MSNKFLLAANWKMHYGPSKAHEFIESFVEQFSPGSEKEVLFFPASIALTAAVAGSAGKKSGQAISFGVQNIYWEEKGAFTGEISASMAKEGGAKYVLVGHSERRHVFGETDEQCAKKCSAAETAGLFPLLCVGETLEQREAGQTEAVVVSQLKNGLSSLESPSSSVQAIAYEPVWAIGTGKNATPADAATIHNVLRATLVDMFGATVGAGIRILYGGSVKPDNARELLDAENVDGLLVGGASLDVDSWLSICSV